jgi:hypothetical protein
LFFVVEFLTPQPAHANSEETAMKIGPLVLSAIVLYGFPSFAANNQTGTIISEKSVECGTKNKGKKTVKSSTAVLCQQYVVHTATTEYEIRQSKPSSQAIIPANSAIQFAVNKDKMKFKLNGKSYEFLIVGTSAIAAAGR